MVWLAAVDSTATTPARLAGATTDSGMREAMMAARQSGGPLHISCWTATAAERSVSRAGDSFCTTFKLLSVNDGDPCVLRALAQSDRMLCCAAIVFGGARRVPASTLLRLCNGAIAHGPAHRVARAQCADDVTSAAVGADREDTCTNFLADWRTSA